MKHPSTHESRLLPRSRSVAPRGRAAQPVSILLLRANAAVKLYQYFFRLSLGRVSHNQPDQCSDDRCGQSRLRKDHGVAAVERFGPAQPDGCDQSGRHRGNFAPRIDPPPVPAQQIDAAGPAPTSSTNCHPERMSDSRTEIPAEAITSKHRGQRERSARSACPSASGLMNRR